MKVLLYWPENDVLPKGGPRGYLYNLLSGLNEIQPPDVTFDLLPARKIENNPLRNFIRDRTPRRLRDIKRLKKYEGYIQRNASVPVDVNEYDFIHFQQVQDLYFAREALADYRGKILLTSHTPCAPQDELIARLDVRDVQKHKDQLASLSAISEYAFNRADFIIFPCEGAEEPYFHTWEGYASLKERNADKYRYLLTGIAQCSIKVPRNDIRAQLGIPERDFVISYAGRHNEIKGYDRIVRIGDQVLDDPHTWVVVAGKSGRIVSPHHPRWIELGWTDDPHSYIAASDVFLLPNRETYFDLALLEVLSLGVPVITTKTGGNLVFKDLQPNGITLIGDEHDLPKAISQYRQMPPSEWQQRGELNRNLFLNNFTSDIFANNYVRLLKSL